MGERRRFQPMHKGIMPACMKAPGLGDLALGDQPQLGVGEGMEGHSAHPEQPGAQAALDLEAKRALGAGHPALALDPQLLVGICQISRHFQAMMLDIASIDRKNRNISHCQVILARKLTEPADRLAAATDA
jgi:hypothetical protein